MSDPNLPNGEQPTTPLQPPAASAEPPAVPPTTPIAPQQPPTVQQPQQPAGNAPQPPAYGSVPPAAPQQGGQPPYGSAPPQVPQMPQPGYAAGGYPPVQPKGLALSSLIVGIASLVFFWTWVIGLLGGIAAVVLGIIGLRKGQSKGMSLTGIITGGVAVLISVGVIIFTLFFFGAAVSASNSALKDLDQATEELESTMPTPSDSASAGASEGASDVASAAAADAAADAASGGSSDTGDRSPEFCDALTAFSTTGSTGELTDDVLASLKTLADISSPNQSVYQRFYDYAQDPTIAEDSGDLIDDYMEAVGDDAMACI